MNPDGLCLYYEATPPWQNNSKSLKREKAVSEFRRLNILNGCCCEFPFSIPPFDSCPATKESINQAVIVLNVLEGHIDKAPCFNKKSVYDT